MKRMNSKDFRAKYVKPKRVKPLGSCVPTEEQEQFALCEWVKHKYPNVLYTVDLGGVRLTPAQLGIMKTRSKRGHPDLMFQEWYKDKYCGLAIEFKRKGVKVLNKKGEPKDEHISQQLNYLNELSNRCWFAVFVSGLENAKTVIDSYMEGKDLKELNDIIYPKTI